MPTLYLVATPIGNLQDITLRALNVLADVALIAAEDTRTTRKLLSRHGIRSRLLSYNEHNMRSRTPQILDALADDDVAFASEAGAPGVSDPGHELVVAAVDAGYDVVPVPGASALTAALSVSGMPAQQFIFLGFLPRRAGERRRLLASLTHEPRTLVAFEAPHRLRKTLTDMQTTWTDRHIVICRELTKAFEEIFRGTITEALAHFTEPRGEFTLVVAGGEPAPPPSDDAVIAALNRLRDEGLPASRAVGRVTKDLDLPRRRVYRLSLQRPSAPRSADK
jgi:16S rRNA (cytidine1402-2'-O)-methyltransferase